MKTRLLRCGASRHCDDVARDASRKLVVVVVVVVAAVVGSINIRLSARATDSREAEGKVTSPHPFVRVYRAWISLAGSSLSRKAACGERKMMMDSLSMEDSHIFSRRIASVLSRLFLFAPAAALSLCMYSSCWVRIDASPPLMVGRAGRHGRRQGREREESRQETTYDEAVK